MIAVNEKGPPKVFVNGVAQGELRYYEVDPIPPDDATPQATESMAAGFK